LEVIRDATWTRTSLDREFTHDLVPPILHMQDSAWSCWSLWRWWFLTARLWYHLCTQRVEPPWFLGGLEHAIEGNFLSWVSLNLVIEVDDDWVWLGRHGWG
jgi:hypothetical protein